MSDHMDCTRVQEALPWYVNDTATAAQCRDVKAHLQQCAGCAAEAEWLLAVKSEIPALAGKRTVEHADVEYAFEQLMERIERRKRKHERWQLLAAASVLLAIATLLGSMLTSYLIEPRFQVVTDALPPQGNMLQIEIRFASEAQLASLRNVMERTAAEVRKGPDADGWVVLDVPLRDGQAPEEVLAAIRADTQVLEARLSTGGKLRNDEAEH